ncbi:MAG: aspartate kinase [Bdellovibrionales bacterium]|nr:aspartate kinase [Bdellovibrionales bacterium]
MNHKQIHIKKFGGTSVGSIEKIEQVADRIAKDKLLGQNPLVVVSAMSGETNRLISLATQIAPSCRGQAYDMLLASGEQVSVALLALALEKRNIKATPLLAHQVGIKTDSLFSRARIQEINTKQIKTCLKMNHIPLVAGFQGVTNGNTITTLGRGGSDTTAVALAVAFKQSECEIFTDVPKIYTADPRLIKKATQIPKLSFEEMMEMSSLGSQVLHCRSVEIAAKYKIKIHVRSTFEQTEGTWILPKEEFMENPLVSAVTHDRNTVIIKMYPVPSGTEFIANLFTMLAEKHISVDIISQSYHKEGQRLAFSITAEDLEAAKKIIYEIIEQKKVHIIEGLAKLSIVGVGMANHPGVAARFFKVLNKIGVDMHLVTTSEIKISAIIDKKYLSEAAQAIHEEFILIY